MDVPQVVRQIAMFIRRLDFDARSAVYVARALHLLSLGHRHVGHVAGPQNSDKGRRRLAGSVELEEIRPRITWDRHGGPAVTAASAAAQVLGRDAE